MNILIIDDSSFARMTIHTIMKHILPDGVFFLSDNGAAALEIYRQEKPDLILTDLLMPKMGGADFVALIREQDPLTPIIVMTANIQNAVKARLEAMGIQGFIHKPAKFDKVEEIRALVERCLHVE